VFSPRYRFNSATTREIGGIYFIFACHKRIITRLGRKRGVARYNFMRHYAQYEACMVEGVAVMARDATHEMRLEDLTDAEIERIEGALFCMGGPPAVIGAALVARATTGAPRQTRPEPRYKARAA